jgi:hypothetical protein
MMQAYRKGYVVMRVVLWSAAIGAALGATAVSAFMPRQVSTQHLSSI